MMPGKLKIIQFVRGAERYGAAVSIKNLCLELDRRGHEVVLMTSKGKAMPVDRDRFRTIELPPFHKFDLRGILAVRAALVREKPDLVHTHLSAATITGSLAARLAKVPVISTVHGMNKKWTYGFADRLITVSEAGKRNLVEQGIPSGRISVAYNGIDLPRLPMEGERQAARAAVGFEPDDIVFGTVSRADRSKGVQDALAALAILKRRVPNARFLFAGEGEYLDRLKQLTEAFGLSGHVRFLGFQEDIYSVLSMIDLFVFPSLREAMGISIVEAMAMGKPVVGTRVGGIPEVVDEESGVLVPPNSPPDLAEACYDLTSNRALLQTMGTRGRERVATKFNIAVSAEAVEAAYHKLLKHWKAPPLIAREL